MIKRPDVSYMNYAKTEMCAGMCSWVALIWRRGWRDLCNWGFNAGTSWYMWVSNLFIMSQKQLHGYFIKSSFEGMCMLNCTLFISYLIPFGFTGVSIHSRLGFIWKEPKGVHLQCAVEIWQGGNNLIQFTFIWQITSSLWMYYISKRMGWMFDATLGK